MNHHNFFNIDKKLKEYAMDFVEFRESALNQINKMFERDKYSKDKMYVVKNIDFVLEKINMIVL